MQGEYSMARDGITFEQVAAAADALVGQGKQPTIKAIRDALRTGSPNTVHRHMVAWREAGPRAVAAALVPASLTSAIAEEIGRAVAQARAEVEVKLREMQAEAAELSEVGEMLEADRDALVERVAALTTDRDTIAGKAEQMSLDMELLRSALADSEKNRQQAEQQVAALTAKLDNANDRIKDAKQVATDAAAVAEKARDEAAELRGRMAAESTPARKQK
jgi:colicin import membrane protein